MVIVNNKGYLERTNGRNWWLVKHGYGNTGRSRGFLQLWAISFPLEYVGRKIRIKVEVVDDGSEIL